MGNDEKNGRINYIRDDFLSLRREMQKGFKDLSAELRSGCEGWELLELRYATEYSFIKKDRLKG